MPYIINNETQFYSDNSYDSSSNTSDTSNSSLSLDEDEKNRIPKKKNIY